METTNLKELCYIVQQYLDKFKTDSSEDKFKTDSGEEDNDVKCEMAMEASLIESWNKVPKIVAIVRRKEYALIVLSGRKLANNLFYDIFPWDVIPIDKTFRCELEKSRKAVDGSVPLRVSGGPSPTGEVKQLTFEFPSAMALTFHSHVRKVATEAGEQDFLFVDYTWLDKYRADGEARKKVDEHQVDCESEGDRSSGCIEEDCMADLMGEAPPGLGGQGGNRSSTVRTDMDMTWLAKQLGQQSLAGAGTSDSQWFVQRKLMEREKEYCSWVNHTAFVGSWNVNGRLDEALELESWLRTQEPPDFYVLGFQELELSLGSMALNRSHPTPVEEKWLKLVEACPQISDRRYTRLSRARLAGILLVVYVRTYLYPQVNKQELVSSAVPCGMFNVMGNKGSVGIRLTLDQSSICFLNCHLAAGEGNKERRNQDYQEIARKMIFETPDGNVHNLSSHDIIFFFGDLNYRIDKLEYEFVRELIRKRDFDHLRGFDELLTQRLAKSVFQDFQEGEINFAPTYKFDPNTGDYDMSEKNRVPSYCDRILWCGQHCEQLVYRSHEEFGISDHKPVASSFNVGIKRVDQLKLQKTYEAVIRSMDLLYNMYLPQAKLNTHDVDFGEVRFMEPKQTRVTLTNTGQSPFIYDFKARNDEPSKFPKWLTVNPPTRNLEKGESCTLVLEAYINSDTISQFQTGELDLSEILVLTLQGGKHLFLSTAGKFVPTSFGLSLGTLLALKRPVRDIPGDELLRMVKSRDEEKSPNKDKSSIFTVPREIYRLIDYIITYAIEDQDLFQQPGLHPEIQTVREALDTTATDVPLPAVRVHSIIESLLMFLNSLAVPIVPKEFCGQCLDAHKSFQQAVQTVSRLPAQHRNAFHYVTSFLRRCIDHSEKNGTDPELLASIFGEIFFRDYPGSHEVRLRKMDFLKLFIINDTTTYIAQFRSLNKKF